MKIRVLGSEGLKIDKKGNLVIKSSFGNIKMIKPTAYQKINKQKNQRLCKIQNTRKHLHLPYRKI